MLGVIEVRGNRRRIKLDWRDVAILVESVKHSEEVKPIQQAKRDVFSKYGVLGSSRDPELTALFYGIMLRQGLLDRIISELTGTNPFLLDPRLRAALRVFIYLEKYGRRKIWYSNRIEAIKRVSAWISKNVHPYAGMWFMDTILKLDSYEFKPSSKEEELMEKYLLPSWYIRRIIDLLGRDEAVEIFKSFLKRPLISIRVNTLKSTVDEVLEELKREGKKPVQSKIIPTVIKFRGPYNFDRSRLFREGKIIIQEEPAALASIILDPKPGMVVVDLAAAPGGKTEHIAELMENRGVIYAFDVDEKRMERLEEIIRRAGVEIVKTFIKDAREAPRILGEEIADRVLVDAPCTSDGTIAKNPDLRWRMREEEVAKFAQLQYELLKAAVKLVKPGGYILYTTCTLLRDENEDVVEKMLRKEGKKAELVPLEKPYDPGFLPGTMRAWPHKHGTIGFFYALFRKKAKR